MFVFARAVTYATIFIALVLVFLPARILSSAGVTQPAALGPGQIAGMIVGALGAAVVVWCILAFAVVGKGTPAPFDPPRRLVVRGPYQFVRNPMYVGAGIALAGAALFYQSWAVVGYIGFLFVAATLLVMTYEEPTLRNLFGREYDAYCEKTGRWIPRW